MKLLRNVNKKPTGWDILYNHKSMSTHNRKTILFFVSRLDQAMQQNVAAGFTILPGGFLDFHVASAADAGHENHGRGGNLIHVAGVVAGTADHVQVGVAQVAGC